MKRTSQIAAGVLALLLLLGAILGCGRGQRWNVLVVTLDTTRADYLGCYGRQSARTPHFDRLAAEGFLFEHAVSAAPITLPSHSTIFTGTYPPVHGVRDNGLFQLPGGVTTLAEILKGEGYATAAAVGSYPLSHEFGIAQGFDLYDDHITINAEDPAGHRKAAPKNLYFDERSAVQVNDAILPWLREHLDRPFFAWIHYWDAHHPHIPPEPYSQLYPQDLYQGEIAFVDNSFGTILRALDEGGALERTLIVIVGDHGEGRGEHFEDTHSMLAYDSTLHVPLILKVPGMAGGRRIGGRVGTVDILPTLLDLLGIGRRPEEIQGRSFLSQMRAPDSAATGREVHYAEALSPRLSYGWGELRALYRGNLKYIHGPRPELFDLEADPRELQNLAPGRPTEAAQLKQDLEVFLARQPKHQADDAVKAQDAEVRQRLAALGYISGGGDAPENIQEKLLDGGVPPQERIGDNSLASFAKQLLANGDFLRAKDSAEQLISRDPDNAFYRGILAQSWLGLGDAERAAAVLEQPSQGFAQNDATFVDVARELWSRDLRQRGRALIEGYLRNRPTADGLYVHAEMLGELGDLAGQESDLRQAIGLQPKHGSARLSLAILLAGTSRRAEGETLLAGLLADFPLNARYHFNYAVVLLEPAEPSRQELAIGHFERAIHLNPSYWKAYLQLLALRLERGESEQAGTLQRQLEARCTELEVIQQARNLIKRSAA
jgi:arylsulfatase A-like enzyme/predicted Zn-dependent protease